MKTLFRIGLSLIATLFLMLPLEIWLVLNYFAQPTGFWQKAFMIGFGLYLGGAIQFGLCIVLLYCLVFIWTLLE